MAGANLFVLFLSFLSDLCVLFPSLLIDLLVLFYGLPNVGRFLAEEVQGAIGRHPCPNKRDHSQENEYHQNLSLQHTHLFH